MSSVVTIRPYAVQDIGACAELLRRRIIAEKRMQHLLPDEINAFAALKDLADAPGRVGVVALKNTRIVGYLLAVPRIDALWGRTAWVQPAGFALAPEMPLDVLHDLYETLSAPLVERGWFGHYALVPATRDDALQAWFTLGFGKQQCYAVLNLSDFDAEAAFPAGVRARRATAADADRLAARAHTVLSYHTTAPVFAIGLPEAVRELQQGFRATVTTERDDYIVLIAEKDGEIAAYAIYAKPTASVVPSLVAPSGAIELASAGTHPALRNTGLGTALARYGLTYVKHEGYTQCRTDWRTTNRLAARFWPRFGFTPLYYRLERRIDPRIAWAQVAQ